MKRKIILLLCIGLGLVLFVYDMRPSFAESFNCSSFQANKPFRLYKDSHITPIISGVIIAKSQVSMAGYDNLPYITYKNDDDYMFTLYPATTNLEIGDPIIAGQTTLIRQEFSPNSNELGYSPFWVDIRDMLLEKEGDRENNDPCKYQEMPFLFPQERSKQMAYIDAVEARQICLIQPNYEMEIFSKQDTQIIGGIKGSLNFDIIHELSNVSILKMEKIEAVEATNYWLETIYVGDRRVKSENSIDQSEPIYERMLIRYINIDPNPLLKAGVKINNRERINFGRPFGLDENAYSLMPFSFNIFEFKVIAAGVTPDLSKQPYCEW